MKSETRRVLTFIAVGCLTAAILGYVVWQASSPTRLNTDSAMETTAVSTHSPAAATLATFTEEEEIPNSPSPVAVDTEDPLLPPNAYIPEPGYQPYLPTTSMRPFEPSTISASPLTEPGSSLASSTPTTSTTDPDTGLPPTSEPTAPTEPSEPTEPEPTTEPPETGAPEPTDLPSTEEAEPTSEITRTPEPTVTEESPTDFVEEPEDLPLLPGSGY